MDQNSLGIKYERMYTEKANEEAVKWYRKSAEQGNVFGQYNLGRCYDRGAGVMKDDAEAMKWYFKSAEQGLPLAQCMLGGKFASGEGVGKDLEVSASWYRTAAEEGDGEGQYYLADCYKCGKGVAENNVLSYMWYNLAAASGYSGVLNPSEARDEIAKKMSTDQILKAQQLSKEWKSNHRN